MKLSICKLFAAIPEKGDMNISLVFLIHPANWLLVFALMIIRTMRVIIKASIRSVAV